MNENTFGDAHVAIILPTYNGARYLGCQLDSILNQSWSNLDIYIRDDGSTDNTVSIIRDYASSHSQIHFIEDDLGNLGCPSSFYQIIRSSPASDFYAFADQDDVWNADKVERALRGLSELRRGAPAVYYSSFTYVDTNGRIIREAAPQEPDTPLLHTLFYTPGLGFTIVFNRVACEQFILDVDPGFEMHDRWLLRCASAFGSVICDPTSTAQHIRHDDAVTAGDNKHLDLVRYFLKEELLGTRSKKESEKLSHFYEVFQDRMTDSDRQILELFASKNDIISRLKKVFYPKSLRPTKAGDFVLRVLFLFGRA